MIAVPSATASVFGRSRLRPEAELSASGFLEKALKLVQKNVKEHGFIICEHPKEVVLPEEVDDFKIKKQYRYGKVHITFYARKGALDE